MLSDAIGLSEIEVEEVEPIITKAEERAKKRLHNFYCNYKYCDCPDRLLVPYKIKGDWGLREQHKKCWVEMVKKPRPNKEYIVINPRNTIYIKCKCNKNDGTPCKMKADSDGFNKLFGYCKYHDFKKFHLKYG